MSHCDRILSEGTSWEIHDEEGNVVGIVRDATLNSRSDYMLYQDHSVRREYGPDNLLMFEAERRRRGLTRVWEMNSEWDASTDTYRGRTSYYWYRVRVPWIVWAVFS